MPAYWNQVEGRTVVVQGGAYGEHQVGTVGVEGRVTPIDRAVFTVRLAPGCGTRMVVKMGRYANQPTFAFPWA